MTEQEIREDERMKIARHIAAVDPDKWWAWEQRRNKAKRRLTQGQRGVITMLLMYMYDEAAIGHDTRGGR